MALNLHLLRLFAVVAEQGSFSRAAQVAHISQPAVTKSIQQLEKQVGLPLLERGARGVRLTEVGQMLHGHARAIFAAERAAEDDLQARRGLTGGTLNVGASLTVGTYFLPPYLARFHAAHPQLELRMTSLNTESIAALLLDYKLDIALVEGPVNHERINVRKWRDDELVLVSSPQHPLAKRKKLKQSDLASADWIVREPGSGTREVIDAELRERGWKREHTLEVDSTEAVKQTVAVGMGIAFVSRHSAVEQLTLGKLCELPVPDLAIKRPLTYLTLKNRPLGIAARAFEKLVFSDLQAK